MPTYEYKREDGTIFEIRQGINDDPLEKCPETGQKVKRIISGGGGVVYKGDGWYVKEYKNNSNPSQGSKPAAGGSAGRSDSSADAPDGQTGSINGPAGGGDKAGSGKAGRGGNSDGSSSP